jgi:hypothetical protein
MSQFTIVLLIVSGFVLILGAVMTVRAYIKNRGEKMRPFRDYFGPASSRVAVAPTDPVTGSIGQQAPAVSESAQT